MTVVPGRGDQAPVLLCGGGVWRRGRQVSGAWRGELEAGSARRAPPVWGCSLKKEQRRTGGSAGRSTDASFTPSRPFCIPRVLETDEQMSDHSIKKKKRKGKERRAGGRGESAVSSVPPLWPRAEEHQSRPGRVAAVSVLGLHRLPLFLPAVPTGSPHQREICVVLSNPYRAWEVEGSRSCLARVSPAAGRVWFAQRNMIDMTGQTLQHSGQH